MLIEEVENNEEETKKETETVPEAGEEVVEKDLKTNTSLATDREMNTPHPHSPPITQDTPHPPPITQDTPHPPPTTEHTSTASPPSHTLQLSPTEAAPPTTNNSTLPQEGANQNADTDHVTEPEDWTILNGIPEETTTATAIATENGVGISMATENGPKVATSENGVNVSTAAENDVDVSTAAENGVNVPTVAENGVNVPTVAENGVDVSTAAENGSQDTDNSDIVAKLHSHDFKRGLAVVSTLAAAIIPEASHSVSKTDRQRKTKIRSHK